MSLGKRKRQDVLSARIEYSVVLNVWCFPFCVITFDRKKTFVMYVLLNDERTTSISFIVRQQQAGKH